MTLRKTIDTTYFDSKWAKCTKAEAVYFRTAFIQEDGLFNVTDRYLNGKPQMAGTMKSFNPDVFQGKFVFYDSLGTTTSIENYRNGVLEGEQMTYYPGSQQIKQKGTDHLGKHIGWVLMYDSLSGNVRGRQHYNKSGSMDTMRTFSSTGKLYMYMRLTGINQRQVTAFDSMGNKLWIANFDTTNRKEGLTTVFYHGTNAIKYKSLYKGGLPDGPFIRYDYTCQKPVITGQYSRGKRSGEWKNYASCTDAVIYAYSYIDGKIEGKYVKYDPISGMLMMEGQDAGGLETGEWKYYFKGTDKLRMTRTFKEGRFDGKLVSYYPNGKTRRVEEYANGTMTKWNCYGINGDDTIYYKRFVQAVLPDNYQQVIAREMSYPKKAYDAKLDGKVTVSLKINDDGTLTEADIAKTTNNIFNDEALRLAELIPILSPAFEDGLPIHTTIKIPITFTYSEAASPEVSID